MEPASTYRVEQTPHHTAPYLSPWQCGAPTDLIFVNPASAAIDLNVQKGFEKALPEKSEKQILDSKTHLDYKNPDPLYPTYRHRAYDVERAASWSHKVCAWLRPKEGHDKLRSSFVLSLYPIILAGTPTAMLYAGIELVTTAPAPTTAPLPMTTPSKIVALEPIQTSSSMVMPL